MITIIVVYYQILYFTGDVVSVADGGQCDKCEVYALVERPVFKIGYKSSREEDEDNYSGYQVCYYVQDEAQLRSHHPLRLVAVMSSKNLRCIREKNIKN